MERDEGEGRIGEVEVGDAVVTEYQCTDKDCHHKTMFSEIERQRHFDATGHHIVPVVHLEVD